MLKIHPTARERGMATLEALAILPIFLVIVSYSLGSFGVIHTAILHSIAARTYAFETFRHRTDLTYLRDNRLGASLVQYNKVGARVHGIGIGEGQGGIKGEAFYATERSISKGFTGPDVEKRDADTHNNSVPVMDPRKRAALGVNPVWIMVQYGICLNSTCGGS